MKKIELKKIRVAQLPKSIDVTVAKPVTAQLGSVESCGGGACGCNNGCY